MKLFKLLFLASLLGITSCTDKDAELPNTIQEERFEIVSYETGDDDAYTEDDTMK